MLDLAQVTRCDAAALLAIATGARRLSQRRGWLRLIATSLPVVAALDDADLCDLIDLYQSHNGARDAS